MCWCSSWWAGQGTNHGVTGECDSVGHRSVTCHTGTFLTEHSRPFLVAPASIRRQIGLIDFLGPLNGPFTDFCDLCPHAPCSWLTIPVICSVIQWHLMGQVLILDSYVNMVNRCDVKLYCELQIDGYCHLPTIYPAFFLFLHTHCI